MGTTLTGTTPQDTYDSLIKVTDNGPISGTAKFLSDGLGNDSALALSTSKVGIGTASPTGKLTVSSGAAGGGYNSDYDELVVSNSGRVGINILSSTTEFGAIIMGGKADNTTGGIYHNASTNMLSLATQDAFRLNIDNAGNVGIGTSAPSAMLTLKSVSPFIRIERDGVPHWQIQNNTLVNDAGFSINNATNVATPFFINGTTNQVGILNANPLQPLDVTGNIRSSTGILFGADTAAANLLDDYEEGTWTPSVNGTTGTATYSVREGYYTKIGRQVVVQFFISFQKNTISGGVSLGGLPFTLGFSGGNQYPQAQILFDNLASAYNNPLLQLANNSTTADLIIDNGTTGSHAAMQDTQLGPATMAFRGTATYFV